MHMELNKYTSQIKHEIQRFKIQTMEQVKEEITKILGQENARIKEIEQKLNDIIS
jgi:hypothetical protein